MAIINKNLAINTMMVTTALALSACSTVRDTTDWIPGVDSNEEVAAEEKEEAKEAMAKERERYEDKVAFAPTNRTASNSDARISVEIAQQYADSDDINREDIGIEVNANVVTLTGSVSSNDSAVSAIAIAKSAQGVSRVISKLVVVSVRMNEEEVEIELPASTETPGE